MKRFIICIITLVMTLGLYAEGLNSQQSKLRNDILSFLKEEGFMPEIDNDGDIAFKREGQKWYITVNSDDTNPMFITLYQIYAYNEDYTKAAISEALAELNSYKGVKTRVGKSAYFYEAELYLVNAEPFKYAFYKLLKQIESMKNNMAEIVANGGTEEQQAPLTYEASYIGNLENSGTVIDDFGSKIYSYKTKYLALRFYSTIKTAGSYTFYVKFYDADGKLSTYSESPAGYTYKTTKQLEAGYHSIQLPGWGNENSGNWKAGQYRYEVYLNNKKIGEKTFTVY